MVSFVIFENCWWVNNQIFAGRHWPLSLLSLEGNSYSLATLTETPAKVQIGICMRSQGTCELNIHVFSLAAGSDASVKRSRLLQFCSTWLRCPHPSSWWSSSSVVLEDKLMKLSSFRVIMQHLWQNQDRTRICHLWLSGLEIDHSNNQQVPRKVSWLRSWFEQCMISTLSFFNTAFC